MYLVTLHLAALWVIFTLNVGHVPSVDTAGSTAVGYVRQIFLVQLWFQPFFDGSSWDGPAWSISAEWLAYLLFGVLVLVLFRMAQVTRARSLMVLAFAASLPPVLLLLDQRTLLHTVELVAADRDAVHRRCAGLRRGTQARPTRPWPRSPRGSRPWC